MHPRVIGRFGTWRWSVESWRDSSTKTWISCVLGLCGYGLCHLPRCDSASAMSLRQWPPRISSADAELRMDSGIHPGTGCHLAMQ